MTATSRPDAPAPLPPPPNFRDGQAVAELFISFLRRDLTGFYPCSRFEPVVPQPSQVAHGVGPRFRLIEASGSSDDSESGDGEGDQIEIFGARYAIGPRPGHSFSAHDRRMIRAIGAVLELRYHQLFQSVRTPRLEIYRGGSEDHYIAAFIEPSAYMTSATRPSRIASTIQTLRTAALSTYENRRVSTGALLLGRDDDPDRETPPDALMYGVELTSLKSIYRLCDGGRTLYLVDRDGRLAEIVDVAEWAARHAEPSGREPEIPCARAYRAHARATRSGGHVCVVLSPNQEIKLFAGGAQAFAFAHGRWRILDPAGKFEVWCGAIADQQVARVLFQTALDLAEARQGGLFVVVNDPCAAVGGLIAPHDLLSDEPRCGPPVELTPGDPLAKRALHYLARGRNLTDLEPSLIEALARLDGALVTDAQGQLLAFGAILRHDPALLPGLLTAEGARTTAALVASRFGPVLKVSEDGVVSCFIDGVRVWDL